MLAHFGELSGRRALAIECASYLFFTLRISTWRHALGFYTCHTQHVRGNPSAYTFTHRLNTARYHMPRAQRKRLGLSIAAQHAA